MTVDPNRDQTGAAVTEGEPCTRNGYDVGAPMGSMFFACDACGHARIMHPGRHNPAVESCALCRLEAVIHDAT